MIRKDIILLCWRRVNAGIPGRQERIVTTQIESTTSHALSSGYACRTEVKSYHFLRYLRHFVISWFRICACRSDGKNSMDTGTQNPHTVKTFCISPADGYLTFLTGAVGLRYR
jgi:hypothetical protein